MTTNRFAALAVGLSGLVLVATLGLFVFFTSQVHAASTQVPGVTQHTINPPKETQDFYTFFTATTTTATSTTAAGGNDPGFVRIGGATDVIFYFTRGDTKGTGNTGSTQFKVQVTPDGTTWLDYNELGQVTMSGNADTFFLRVGTTTLPAGTTTQMWAMEDIGYYGARCIAVRTTDGDNTCKASVTF